MKLSKKHSAVRVPVAELSNFSSEPPAQVNA